MCSAPKPKAQPLPPARALSRAPQYSAVLDGTTAALQGSRAQRSTVVNPSGQVRQAPTATLGGSSVVLGG